MTENDFSKEWIQQLSDPYAILGVSVTADDRRILKRYRQVAKQLHPDVQAMQSEENRLFAKEVLTRLINPAYQKIKQDKGRNETLATLRFKVRRLNRKQALQATSKAAQALENISEAEIDIFYEKSLNQLISQQFDSEKAFNSVTVQIGELNLIYLKRKMGEPVIREKRTGLMTAPSTTRSNPVDTPPPAPESASNLDYAERHCQRAQQYLRAKNYTAAIQELKDAVRIHPRNSQYHCMLGQAYLLNNLPGMAKVHIKQALRLNPQQPRAQKYAQQLGIDINQIHQSARPNSPVSQSKPQKTGLFGGLFSGR